MAFLPKVLIVASISIYQPCGLPNRIKPPSKPSHPQDLGIEFSSRSRNRVSHSQPPSENVQPQPLGFPNLYKSENSMTHLHLLHLWRHHGVMEARPAQFLVWPQTIRSKASPGSGEVLQLRSSRDRKQQRRRLETRCAPSKLLPLQSRESQSTCFSQAFRRAYRYLGKICFLWCASKRPDRHFYRPESMSERSTSLILEGSCRATISNIMRPQMWRALTRRSSHYNLM